MNKVWKRIRKISGKYNRGRAPSVNVNGNIETDHARVADALATNIAHISSPRFYDPLFLQTKDRIEENNLNFNIIYHFAYNNTIALS